MLTTWVWSMLGWIKANGFGSYGALGALLGTGFCRPKTWSEVGFRVLIGFVVSLVLTPLIAPLAAGVIEQGVSKSAAQPWKDTPAPVGILIGLMAYWLLPAVIAIAKNTRRKAEEQDVSLFDLVPPEKESRWWEKDKDKSEGTW